MFELDLEKAEEPEIKLPTSIVSSEKQESFRKKNLLLFIDYVKAFDCQDKKKKWKFLHEMGIPDHFICLLRNLYAGQEVTVGTGHGKTDWFQIGKGVCQGCILSPCLFNLHESTSWEMLGLWSTIWYQDYQEKYQSPQICRWYHPYGRKQRRTIKPLDESERGEWKSWLKTQQSEN